jgi:hypothetical protein
VKPVGVMICQEVAPMVRFWLGEKTGCTVGSGAAIRRRSIAAVEVEAGSGVAVPDGSGEEAVVNVARFSTGVRPLRTMEKRS